MEALSLSLGFGCIAGLLSGLFGIGGGVVIVPFLLWLFPRLGFVGQWIMVMAVATSLATIVITSLSATLAQHKRGTLDWGMVARLSPSLIVGSMAGSVIAGYLPVAWFKLGFAGFLFYIGGDLLVSRAVESGSGPSQRMHPLLAGTAGLGIGAFSSILGIGGGTLSMPFLIKQHFPIRSAVAISSACAFPIALAGTLTQAALGWSIADLPPGSLGFVYLPAFGCIALTGVLFAPLGVHLAHHWPVSRLKTLLGLALMVIAIRIVWQLLPAL